MTNPPYDPNPTTGSSSVPGSYPTDPYATTDPVVTEDYAAAGYVGTTGSGEQSTKDVAKDEAAKTKDTAVDAGKNVAATAKSEASNVASTAKSEASNVVAEATGQAKNLVGTVTGELKGQLSTQQQRLAGGIHSVASELGSFGAKSEAPGPVADLAQQAAQRVGAVGHWLETREPADILEELRSFARRRPGLFLGLSALAGVVAGRIGRGAVAANTQLDSADTDSGYSSTTVTSSYGTPTYAGSTYDEPVSTSTTYGAATYGEGTAYSTGQSDYSIDVDRDTGTR